MPQPTPTDVPTLFGLHTVMVPLELNLIRVSPVYWQPGKFLNWSLLSRQVRLADALSLQPVKVGMAPPRSVGNLVGRLGAVGVSRFEPAKEGG